MPLIFLLLKRKLAARIPGADMAARDDGELVAGVAARKLSARIFGEKSLRGMMARGRYGRAPIRPCGVGAAVLRCRASRL